MKMKIPNGGPGNGTYYGQETGITSYVDNNSDTEAEVQAIGDGDFSEYLWMENEEEFDKQVSYLSIKSSSQSFCILHSAYFSVD